MSKGFLKNENKEAVYIVNMFNLQIRNMTTNLVSQVQRIQSMPPLQALLPADQLVLIQTLMNN